MLVVPPTGSEQQRPVLFRWPPSLGQASVLGRVPEYELEKEREKTLRQH